MPSSRKVTLGVFLVGGILLFALGLFLIGDRRKLFSESIVLNAQFSKLGGLKNGSNVLVGGLEAGEVTAIQVPPVPEGKFTVSFRVLEKFRPVLRKDSVASIQMDGLVGNRVLQVEAGTRQGGEVASGDTIRSREPVEITDMIEETVTTVLQARGAIDEIKVEVNNVVQKLFDISQQAGDLVAEVGGEVKTIAADGTKISSDIREVVDGVRAGRGTVGKLFTDDRIYDRLRGTVSEAEQTAANLRATSAELKQVASDIKSRDIAGNIERTMGSVRGLTEKGKEAIATLLPTGSGERGMAESLRETLDNTNEAMADFADNTEALKHNWLFRGFFNKRGYFDMDSVSVADYQAGKFAPNRDRRREWVHRDELFRELPDGSQELTEEGKQKLDSAIAGFLRYARNSPIMVEGYASAGGEDEQFLRSLERAMKVRTYLARKFQLKPNYVGVMPLGAVASKDGKPWDGAALVLFLEREKK